MLVSIFYNEILPTLVKYVLLYAPVIMCIKIPIVFNTKIMSLYILLNSKVIKKFQIYLFVVF